MRITFAQALCLTFIILKLCNVIDWSWWWVTSPIWILILIIIVLAPFVRR